MKLRNLTLSLLISCNLILPLYGAETDENQPVLYYADTQTYDRELGILILKGHVEFDHLGNILEADCVTYNEVSDVVTASGNVRLRQPNGDVNFADYLELTGDMKEGITLQLRTLLADDSKIAALEGRKFEDRQELDQAVYTPCELCGDKGPTWQVNARHAIKDDLKKDITFTDAEFRLLDIPLFYMPYATQPLERRSGFLIPTIGSSSKDFGGFIEIPYFIALSEDKDITLTPVFYTENNPLLLGEYREAFGNGVLNLEGGIANYKKSDEDDHKVPDTRGYVFGNLKLNLSEIWRLRTEGGYVSDKTFFRKYQISGWQNENTLTSKAILEGFLNQRDYAAAKAYYFQGLRVGLDHQERISAPLPMLEYSAYSGVDPLGGRFKFDGNLLNLFRQEGLNMQRAIGEVEWQRPWNTPIGQVFTVFGSTRGDLYKVEHSGNGKKENNHHSEGHHHGKFEGGARFFPQAGFDWRWPFINSFSGQSVVVQPVAQLIAAPDKPVGADNNDIPNEDSVDFEFNDANLFSRDRFPGYDRIDTGSRVIYGGEVLATGNLFGDLELFLGQSYSFSNFGENKRLRKQQGLKRQASDYVGRIEANPYSWLSLNYRFRVDQKSFDLRVAEAGASLGPAIARLSGTYLFVSKHALIRNRMNQDNGGNFNQISLNFSSQFTKHWSLVANVIKNLEKTMDERGRRQNSGILEKSIGLIYRDDCFGLGVTAKRQYYKSADVDSTTIFLFTVYLKNLGTYSTSLSPQTDLFGNTKASEK